MEMPVSCERAVITKIPDGHERAGRPETPVIMERAVRIERSMVVSESAALV